MAPPLRYSLVQRIADQAHLRLRYSIDERQLPEKTFFLLRVMSGHSTR